MLDTPRSCLRIVMAHTDTTPNGPGANDNASGVGVVVALAVRLARLRPRCDVWLVATARRNASTRARPTTPGRAGARSPRAGPRWPLAAALALSLDEVGRDRPFWLRSPAGSRRPRVEGELLRAGREARVPVAWVRDGGSGNSDHREFGLLGLPAAKLRVGAGGEPCRHMPCDRPGRLDRRSLAEAQRLVERALRAP